MFDIDIIFNKIEEISKIKHFKFKLVCILTFLILFFATPAYNYMPEIMDCKNNGNCAKDISVWNATMEKVNNPISNLSEYNPISNASKKVFRITVPIIMKITFSNPYRIYIIQFLVGMLFLFLIYKFSFKITDGDYVSSFLIIFGLAFTYYGRACFVDIYSWFDGWAFLFLLLVIMSKKWYFIFLVAVLAAFTDERALIALPIAFIYHQLIMDKNKSVSIIEIIKLNKNSIAVASAMLFYFITRFLLSYYFNMKTPNDGSDFNTLLSQTDFLGIGLWTFFEGFWLIIVLFFIILFKNKQFLVIIIYSIILIAPAVVSFMVFDITRSGSYMVFIIFPMLICLKSFFTQKKMRVLLFFSSIITFLFPAYYIITDLSPCILWYKPIFIKIINLI